MQVLTTRDTLFGDAPLDAYALQGYGREPWLSFAKARESLANGKANEASAVLAAITEMPNAESLHRLHAWHYLRGLGRTPPVEMQKQVLGAVVEVGMTNGLDVLAGYTDKTVHYYNYSRAGRVWQHPDDSLDDLIAAMLQAAQAIVAHIGPWKGPRRPPPSRGIVRLNMLTASGLYFGEGPIEVLDRDPMGRPLLQAATSLMRKLVSLPTPPAATSPS
jgi:hypothetical protein